MQSGDRELAKIWVLDDGRTLGGGQRFNLRLAEHLGPRATIVCPQESPIGRKARETGLKTADLSFPDPTLVRLPALLVAASKLRQLVPPDAIVLCGAIRTALVSRLARLTNPTIVLMHERASASRLSVKLTLRNCPAMIVVGSESASAYRRALPRAAIWAVNNFLSPSQLADLSAKRPVSRPVPSSARPTLGVLARLIPEKGVDVLIAELCRYPEGWEKLIVAGPREDEAHSQAIERAIEFGAVQGRVSLIGEVHDIAGFLSQIDALVVPSTGTEGQPTVILEALAAGVPVIVRASMASVDFAGLPVVGYETPADLRDRILYLPPPSDPLLLADRFGVGQVESALREAIGASSAGPSPPSTHVA